ncbi:MAG: ankyrin repeat domain-containing protein [Bryobacteraceae bacterium]|nr:ankyrin repeat domain-containing protein [Bryobacteraceae bacterium]
MKLWLTTLFLTCALVPGAEPVSDQIYSAIRENNLPELQRLLKEPGAADARDRRGNTPLMMASGFGTVDAMRVLIDAGADVNAANGIGITAMMWGAQDLAKLRLLAAKGADVNAKTKLGRTVMMVAAATANSLPSIQFLLSKGADPNVVATAPPTVAMVEAIFGGETETATLLLEKLPPPMLKSPLGGFALLTAAQTNDIFMVKALLARGVDPNFTSPPMLAPPVKNGNIEVGLLTPLILAVAYSSADLVAVLLNSGANPNAKDVRGMSPLGLALSTDRPNLKTIRMLLAKGADPKSKDKYGEDVLTWARKSQHKDVMEALGLTPEAPAMVKLAAAPPNQSVGTAAAKTIDLLQRSMPSSMSEGGCQSCHSGNLPAMALKLARSAGLPANESNLRDQANGALNTFRQFDPVMPQGINSPGAPDLETYTLLQISTGNIRPNLTTDTIVLSLLRQQRPNGAWMVGGIPRPPFEDCDIHRTATAIRAIQEYAAPALKPLVQTRVASAAKWLAAQQPVNNDDRNMQILGLIWAKGDSVATRAKDLAAMQRADGGWSQTPYLASDAYATGQTLHALHSAGMKASSPVYQRGVQFLLGTQKADGSWHVKSRSPKFQPYFQSGFPHGHDQWISNAATAWALMGLAPAVQPPPRAD